MGLDQSGVAAATATLGWQIKLSLLMIPAVAYWFLIRGQQFPETERVAAGVSTADMCREALRPGFILLWIMMWMTAATELGPDQWVGSLITNLTGMQGILILVYTAGLMFVLRFFAGGVAHHVAPHALLAVCSALAAAGLFGLSRVTTPVEAFVAATLFGVGKTYFWPIMLGITAEQFPKGGALLLAIMGGTGNLSVAFILPIMGGWYDTAGAAAAFRYVAYLPVVLTALFAALYLYHRAQGGYRAVKLNARGLEFQNPV
jgi:hypothetical protein